MSKEKISKNRIAKGEEITEIKEKIQKAKSIVFVNYAGLNVATTTALRVEMRKEKVDYKVYKNKLVLRAFNELGITGLDSELQNPLAVAFCYEDETAGARILKNALAKAKKGSFAFGVLGKTKLSKADAEGLASIPSKEVLLSKLLFVLKAPMQKLAVGLNKVAESK